MTITTYDRMNHAIRSERYRYIRYENGDVELYDHTKDPNEWYNLATDRSYEKITNELKKYLPANDESWAEYSSFNVNEYFINQSNVENKDL